MYSDYNLKVSAVIPILTKDALDHLIRALVFRIGVRSVARTVKPLEVLVVPGKKTKISYSVDHSCHQSLLRNLSKMSIIQIQ